MIISSFKQIVQGATAKVKNDLKAYIVAANMEYEIASLRYLDALNGQKLLLTPSVVIVDNTLGYKKIGTLENVYITVNNDTKKANIGVYSKGEKVVLSLEKEINLSDETTLYINNLFKGARERAIAKFGKEAEELIYFKFNKDGGAVAEIIDHYGAEGLKALKKANKIDDVANELIKGKIAYRHIGSNANYLEQLKSSGIIPEQIGQGQTYFSLDKIDDPLIAIDKMQLNAKYIDAVWRAEFDANQLINKTHIPKAKWNNAEYMEVLTRSYPNFGKGGATQFITQSQIKLKRLINLKTGEIINFK